MSRGLTAGADTETKSPTPSAVVFVELDFASGFVRAWDGLGAFPWDSKTWTGTGTLGGIGPVAEKAGVNATGLTLTLDGVDSALIATALTEDYQGRAVNIWLGFLNSSLAVIADPKNVFGGIMDYMEVEEDGPTSTITVYCESWLRVLNRSKDRRYTDQDQQLRFAGDRGFEFVGLLADTPVYWGQSDPKQTPATRKALRKKDKKARKAAKRAAK